MGIQSLFGGRARSVLHQASQGVISVYDRRLGDRASSQDRHYPITARASLLEPPALPLAMTADGIEQ